MKIITFLTLLVVTTLCHSQSIDIRNFKMDENINRNFNQGSRIHYSFEIRGDYTYQTHGYRRIDLILYEDSVTSSNEINRIYWNREGDHQLIFNTYTKKEMWVTINDNSTSTRPGKRFILVAKYAGLTTQFTYTYSNPDRDNDGVPDSVDSCPNEAGSSSNNGCPFVSLANVEITQLRILRNGSTEIFNSNTNSTPILSYGNSYEFIYTLENSGGKATNLNLSKFFSYNSTFDPYDDFFIEQDESSAIAAGGKITLRTFVNPGYGYIGNASVSNNQGCYFITSLVYENGDDSTSEFESRIGFIYSTNTSSRLASSYRLQSFDFSGNLISTKEVKDKVEEKQFVQSLPQGSYIIKSDLGETYKISKN